MAIIQNPTYNPSSAYRPTEWVLSVATALDVEVAICEVTVGATVATELTKSPFAVGGGSFLFKFDVQDIVQNLLAPKAQKKSDAFGVPFTQQTALASDSYDGISISVTYLYRDATTNLLTDLGITDISSIQQDYAATRQHEETMSLAGFIQSFASGNPFLTNMPSPSSICLGESLFIGVIGNLGNAMQIETFRSNGTPIDVGSVTVPSSALNQQLSLGIGPNEIRNTTFDLAGPVDIDDPDVAYYTVTYGSYGAGFIQWSEIRRYNIDTCCCDDHKRLHFFNLLGAADAYTFKAVNDRSYKTESGLAQKPLTWDFQSSTPHSIEDKGAFKIDSRANYICQLESDWLTREEAEWLTELLSSPEVYLETDNGLLPMTIDDVEPQVRNTQTGGVQLVRFKIKSPEANERIIQRN